ncbi:MAG: hypothetical protein WCP29_12095 [Acidobacteriota bacterium]
MKIPTACFVACLLVATTAATARAQDRPFVFSVTTAPDPSKANITATFDVGVGGAQVRSTCHWC